VNAGEAERDKLAHGSEIAAEAAVKKLMVRTGLRGVGHVDRLSSAHGAHATAG
jgi:hypothetical protein